MQTFDIKLTPRELSELLASAISLHSQLLRDKHASQADKDFWLNLVDKLARARAKGQPAP